MVLLILAGVNIAILTGDNGISTQSIKTKEETEIGSEKEQLQLAMTSMKFESENDLIKRKTIFQGLLDNSVGNNQTKAYINGNGYIVHFLATNRIYTIDEKGNFTEEDLSILNADITPGAFDGAGEANNPYIIMSIEDLVEWSKNYSMYTNSYIVLGKTLNFKSELSYANSYTSEYNSFFGVDSNVPLFEIITNKDYAGFIPIAGFNGVFNEKGYKINNLYINRSLKYIGLFAQTGSSSVIKNLEINGEINNLYESNGGSVGGIAGGITGTGTATIINCYNIGNITSKGQSIYACPSGIYGYMPNSIKSLNIINCWNTGTIKTSYWYRGAIIGKIRGITPNVLNCSYLETGPNQSSIATPYSQSYMQSQDFINELNNYIESNEDGIDTKGWAKWIQVDGKYPTLDFNTIWDGEKWATNN